MLTCGRYREQETALKVSSRSIAGREKTVEFVITNVRGAVSHFRSLFDDSLPVQQDYVRQMIRVFEIAEDMESLDDLHSLCTMMSTIRKFFAASARVDTERSFGQVSLNDNGLYEYLLQEDVFLGMAGIMECEYLHHSPPTSLTQLLFRRS